MANRGSQQQMDRYYDFCKHISTLSTAVGALIAVASRNVGLANVLSSVAILIFGFSILIALAGMLIAVTFEPPSGLEGAELCSIFSGVIFGLGLFLTTYVVLSEGLGSE